MPEPQKSATILIVEDDDLILNMYKTKFESEGYTVVLAKDGQEGLRLAQKYVPNVILLDVMLPKLSGGDVLAQIKADQNLANIPVVMLSNLSNEETAAEAKSKGAAQFVVKANSTPQQIVEVVEKYLGN